MRFMSFIKNKFLFCSLLFLLTMLSTIVLALEKIAYDKPVKIATLANARINESSGLAWGRLNQCFWTHNDSGSGAKIYAFDKSGKNLGAYLVKGAVNHDWEDMTTINVGSLNLLVLADIGNNNRGKQTNKLYLVHEPKIDPTAKPSKGKHANLVAIIPFTFDQKQIDCESIAWDSKDKCFYFCSKSIGFWSTVYQLKMPENLGQYIPSSSDKSKKKKSGSSKTKIKPKNPTANKPKTMVAKKIADIEVAMPTAMDISPDGLRCVVLTYKNAYEFERKADETWGKAFDREPRRIVMPTRRQGETICFGADGKTLYLTSEFRPTPLWEVKPTK